MTENDDHRLVEREDEDGTYRAAILRRTPENDQLSDDQIITSLQEWKAKRQRAHERWPMPQPFGQWLDSTEPGPQEPCPECGCWSLRRAAPSDNPAGEKMVVCTMVRCKASPFYLD
jgi:hypothetical protein